MTRIWTEPYDYTRHRNRMGWEMGPPSGIAHHNRAPTLDQHNVVFVQVAAFTFEFHSVAQIKACHAYYSAKHQPTSRLPVASGDYGGDHSEVQRWFERLPHYLREEPKRLRVVDALATALLRIAKGKITLAAV